MRALVLGLVVALNGCAVGELLTGSTGVDYQRAAAACGNATVHITPDSTLPESTQRLTPELLISIRACPAAER